MAFDIRVSTDWIAVAVLMFCDGCCCSAYTECEKGRCTGSRRISYLLPLCLAGHRLGTLDDSIDIVRDIETEIVIDRMNSAAMVLLQPCHNLVAREQAKLLL